MNNLENEYNQNEEKKCTFSPKTNKGKIKCKFIQNNMKKELFDININDSKSSYIKEIITIYIPIKSYRRQIRH